MKKITRRNFTKILGATGTASLVGMPSLVFGASKKVVVVGGGFGGDAAEELEKVLLVHLQQRRTKGRGGHRLGAAGEVAGGRGGSAPTRRHQTRPNRVPPAPCA